MVTLRKGRFTKIEVLFIFRNRHRPVRELAKELGRSEAAVRYYLAGIELLSPRREEKGAKGKEELNEHRRSH